MPREAGAALLRRTWESLVAEWDQTERQPPTWAAYATWAGRPDLAEGEKIPACEDAPSPSAKSAMN